MSGNAAGGGRSKGLAAYVREQTNDGREMADFMIRVMRGEPMPCVVVRPAAVDRDGNPVPGVVGLTTPTLDERMTATAWLADRGFGKPMQKLDGEVRAPITIVHRTPPHDPLASTSQERVLDVRMERALAFALPGCPAGRAMSITGQDDQRLPSLPHRARRGPTARA